MTTVTFTRADMRNKVCTHRQFYSQFVNSHTKAVVLSRFTRKRIVASTCKHFNDIPLAKWDALPLGPWDIFFGGSSLSDKVCVAKEAARQIREAG